MQEYVEKVVGDLVGAGLESSAQVAAYVRGELVVDVAVGCSAESVMHSYSTGKGLTGTVVHVLAEQGSLDYDLRIADVWPEFGRHGKEDITLRHALTHTSAVPVLPSWVSAEDFADWDRMCEIVADTEPAWTPGEQHGYHAWTFGWLVGETVRRATGRTLAEVLEEDIAAPLGVSGELYFGVPESARDRVIPLRDRNWDAAAEQFVAMVPRLDLIAPAAVRPGADLANQLIGADTPATATMSARAVARMYAALMGEVDGVRLISPEHLRVVCAPASTGPDWAFGSESVMTLGYEISEGMVGWSGSGGSLAGMAPEKGLAVGITKNLLGFGDGDPIEGLRAYLVNAVR